jgi:hypothetical protein
MGQIRLTRVVTKNVKEEARFEDCIGVPTSMFFRIEIPSNLTKVKRDEALKILSQAKLPPDRFTAHRNGTFTARYLREWEKAFASDHYEQQLEKADARVAIYKRPSPKMDRGRYITLQFAFATFAS